MVGGLGVGLLVGLIWPEASQGAAGVQARARAESLSRAGMENPGAPGAGGLGADGVAPVGSGNAEDRIQQLSPERLVELFGRVSRLKSESRKYILAYRLAGFLAAEQIQAALKAAKEDLADGDYVTMRALARRWAEIDPKAAVKTGLESQQMHLFYPALESWSHMEPNAPMRWALEQDSEQRLKTLQALMGNRLLDQGQLEELVARASNSDHEDLRQQVLPAATLHLSETAPGNALFAAGSIDDPQLRERTLRLLLTRISRTAPEVGQAWITAQKDLSSEMREQYRAILARRPPPPPRAAVPNP